MMVTRANPVNSKKDTCQLYRYYLVFFYTIMWMLLPLWLVVAHDLLEYRYKDDVTGNLFSSVVVSNMARGFENVGEIILD